MMTRSSYFCLCDLAFRPVCEIFEKMSSRDEDLGDG
jgi:hypothetical protein